MQTIPTISSLFNKPTSAQQYIWHTLSTVAVSVIFTGGTALLQFLGNHPFNLSIVLSVASISFGGALLQAILTLGRNGVFLQQAYHALIDTVQRIENIHMTPQATVSVTTNTAHPATGTGMRNMQSPMGTASQGLATLDTTMMQPLSLAQGAAPTATASAVPYAQASQVAPQFAQPSPLRHWGDSQLLPAVTLPATPQQTDATPSEQAVQG